MEMVMVMAIIAVLVGGVIGLMGDFSEGARVQQAGSDMTTLRSSLIQYKTLAGRYPTSAQGLQSLVTKPTSAPKPKKWVNVMKSIPLDPWGNPYQYKMPGTKDTSTYEIISFGKDGVLGGEDDISSQD